MAVGLRVGPVAGVGASVGGTAFVGAVVGVTLGCCVAGDTGVIVGGAALGELAVGDPAGVRVDRH